MSRTLSHAPKALPTHSLKAAALGLMLAAAALARSTGAPAGVTGAPPGANCTICHEGVANSGSGSVKIEFAGGGTYTPGATYKVHVTVADPGAQRWGFELTARMGANKAAQAGSFSVDNAATTQFSPGSGPGEYVTHTSAGTSLGTSGSNTWEVNWTAPPAGSGTVTFYAAGNAANGNFNNLGDQIYTTSLTATEATAATPTGTSYSLPQLAFGGGWYSALYFSNTTDKPLDVSAHFYKFDGTDLSVPLGGGASVSQQTMTVNPLGTVIMEAPNSGPLQQGWVEVVLPAGITGYGVFRQSVDGRADQEAVVPLSDESKHTANLVWDDTAFTTALAIVHPGDTASSVTITVFGDDGSQIGSVTLNLNGDSRSAFNLRDQPGLAGMAGRRGMARITAASGSVAALGLRFAGEAFTSIPVSYQ